MRRVAQALLVLSSGGRSLVARDELKAELIRLYPEWDRPTSGVTPRHGRRSVHGSRGTRVRQVVQQALKKLEDQGVVAREGGAVRILDRARLTTIVGDQ